MIFIYATDLHGDERKYDDILSYAIAQNIKIIHLGADLLPKGSEILTIQKKFINGYLKKFYERCKENNIKVLAFFGNDDCYSRKKYFKQFGSLLDENPEEIEGYRFIAYPYVCDYPFKLKTACKLDNRQCKHFNGEYGLDVNDSGFYKITDLHKYFYDKSTIEEDLKNISITDKTIFSCHVPPCSVDLDVCGRMLTPGRFDNVLRVGSLSVYSFIMSQQPMLTLCGHIHESYDVSGVWKNYIGTALVVQPGQMFSTRFVVFEIENYSIRSHLIEI